MERGRSLYKSYDKVFRKAGQQPLPEWNLHAITPSQETVRQAVKEAGSVKGAADLLASRYIEAMKAAPNLGEDQP